jgi:hypothetical protein
VLARADGTREHDFSVILLRQGRYPRLRMLEVSFDEWPILVSVGTATVRAEDVRAACDAFEEAFRRGGRFVSLVDASRLDRMPDAVLRKTYADWRAAHVWDLRRHVIGVAIVIGDRPMVRGAFTALSWFARHPSPEAFFARRSEALAWCNTLLRGEGLSPPRAT